MIKLLPIFLLLTSCASIQNEEISGDVVYCGMIMDVSDLLSIYAVEKASSTALNAKKIDTELRSDYDKTIVALADSMSNDVIAIRSVLFTVVVLRNMAPCDTENVKASWQTVNNAIRALERHYDN